MDAKDIDQLNLDLRKFFDFHHHPHVYHLHIWKGDFDFYEMRSAATYSDIADRFEAAIAWIKQVRQRDRPCQCPECGNEDRVARVLSFSVMTGDEDVLSEHPDDLSWLDMIRLLKWAASRLREMPEPAKPCSTCGALS